MSFMYVANTAILIFEFSAEDIRSYYGFLLRPVNTPTIDTEEYYPMCYKVNACQERPLKTLFITLHLLCVKSPYMYIADWLV